MRNFRQLVLVFLLPILFATKTAHAKDDQGCLLNQPFLETLIHVGNEHDMLSYYIDAKDIIGLTCEHHHHRVFGDRWNLILRTQKFPKGMILDRHVLNHETRAIVTTREECGTEMQLVLSMINQAILDKKVLLYRHDNEDCHDQLLETPFAIAKTAIDDHHDKQQHPINMR